MRSIPIQILTDLRALFALESLAFGECSEKQAHIHFWGCVVSERLEIFAKFPGLDVNVLNMFFMSVLFRQDVELFLHQVEEGLVDVVIVSFVVVVVVVESC